MSKPLVVPRPGSRALPRIEPRGHAGRNRLRPPPRRRPGPDPAPQARTGRRPRRHPHCSPRGRRCRYRSGAQVNGRPTERGLRVGRRYRANHAIPDTGRRPGVAPRDGTRPRLAPDLLSETSFPSQVARSCSHLHFATRARASSAFRSMGCREHRRRPSRTNARRRLARHQDSGNAVSSLVVVFHCVVSDRAVRVPTGTVNLPGSAVSVSKPVQSVGAASRRPRGEVQ